MGNDEVSFSARFGGASMTVRVPIDAVLGIYARETGQGMIFAEDEGGPAPQPPDARRSRRRTSPRGRRRRSRARSKRSAARWSGSEEAGDAGRSGFRSALPLT